MKIITKNFIFGIAAIASFFQMEALAERTIVDTTRSSRKAPRRRTVVYERDRGNSTARGVFGGAATGALIGGMAGGGRGAGIGLGVGALTGGLIGSSRDRNRPRYHRVIYEDVDDSSDIEPTNDEATELE